MRRFPDRRFLYRAGLCIGLALHGASSAWADCLTSAARYHQVNEVVLRAIAWEESRMNSWAVRKNSNGSYDIGLTQTNSVHLKELAKFGIGPRHLQDACVSAFVGAWLYRKKVAKHGNTWAAVGAYHSETPRLRDAYARRVYAIVQMAHRNAAP